MSTKLYLKDWNVLAYIKLAITCLYDSLKNTVSHDGMEHAGYLSYLTLLSIFPFLVWFTALASRLPSLADHHEIIEAFLNSLIERIPQDIISGLTPRIREIISGPPANLLTLATIGMLWTSSSIIEGLRTIFNRAYRVSSPPHYLLRRIMSILQFLLITVFMISIVASTKIWSILADVQHFSVHSSYIINTFVLFLCILSLHFILPNKKQSFLGIAPGSVTTVVLWKASSILFVKYLETFHQLSIIYGSLASIIASMIFFYITNLILIYGAELNHSISRAMSLGMSYKNDDPLVAPPT